MKSWVGPLIAVFCLLVVIILVLFAILQGTEDRVHRINNEIKELKVRSLLLEEQVLNGRKTSISRLPNNTFSFGDRVYRFTPMQND